MKKSVSDSRNLLHDIKNKRWQWISFSYVDTSSRPLALCLQVMGNRHTSIYPQIHLHKTHLNLCRCCDSVSLRIWKYGYDKDKIDEYGNCQWNFYMQLRIKTKVNNKYENNYLKYINKCHQSMELCVQLQNYSPPFWNKQTGIYKKNNSNALTLVVGSWTLLYAEHYKILCNLAFYLLRLFELNVDNPIQFRERISGFKFRDGMGGMVVQQVASQLQGSHFNPWTQVTVCMEFLYMLSMGQLGFFHLP